MRKSKLFNYVSNFLKVSLQKQQKDKFFNLYGFEKGLTTQILSQANNFELLLTSLFIA